MVNIKQVIAALLASAYLLLPAACATTGDSRYQNTAGLERPPETPAGKNPEDAAANEVNEPKPRHRGIGLKSDIYKLDDDRGFKIKRIYDEAWPLIHQAILHNDLKIADQDRSKGAFYVNYGGHSLINLSGSLFGDDENKTTYLIKVEGQGDETLVTSGLAKKEEQTDSSALKDGNQDNQADKSEDLTDLLFDTLHDHIKAE